MSCLYFLKINHQPEIITQGHDSSEINMILLCDRPRALLGRRVPSEREATLDPRAHPVSRVYQVQLARRELRCVFAWTVISFYSPQRNGSLAIFTVRWRGINQEVDCTLAEQKGRKGPEPGR